MSISCKNCSSRAIVKNGQARGKQCYRYQNCAYNLYQEMGVLSQKQLIIGCMSKIEGEKHSGVPKAYIQKAS